MSTQPRFGQALEAIRNTANGGRKVSRGEFAKTIGISPTQLRNIEQGRELKSGEYDLIVAAFPQLSSSDSDHVAGRDPYPTPNWSGQHCIQCYAPYNRNGTIEHKASCPDAKSREAAVEKIANALDIPSGVVASAQSVNHWSNWLPAPDAQPLVALSEEELEAESQDTTVTRLTVVNEHPATPSTVYISNSEVQSFKRCRRKWWLHWYRQLELREKDPTGPLATGNRVHRALQAWYVPEGDTPIDPRTALESAISDDWAACVNALAEANREPQFELVKKFNEDTALERAMVEGYLEWLEETGIDRGLRVIAPETYLEVPFPVDGRDVRLIGKIDVRTVREQDGVRLFIDHKTTASLTEPLKTIRQDEQMLHYHLLEWLSDVDAGRCDGALYNMLRKVKRSAKAQPPFYDRVTVMHNEHELRSFQTRLTGIVRNILEVRAALDSGADPNVVAYPTPAKDCSWSCDFFPVCPMFDDGSRVEDMLDRYYKEGNPLSYYYAQRKELGW